MAANDPAERSEIASRASRKRVARLDDDGRRRMTAAARAARRAREISQVRADAAGRGEWLDDAEAERRADQLRREALIAAGRKGVEARLQHARDREALFEMLRAAQGVEFPLVDATGGAA